MKIEPKGSSRLPQQRRSLALAVPPDALPAGGPLTPAAVVPIAFRRSDGGPAPTSTELAEARLDLGRKLAAARRAVGVTQIGLARMVPWSRSTIANVEVGRQNVPRAFWKGCDRVLSANGRLLAAFDKVDWLTRRHRRTLVADACAEGREDPDRNRSDVSTVATRESSTPVLPQSDLEAIFGVLAIVRGKLLAGELPLDLAHHIVERLTRPGLLPQGASAGELNALLADLCQRMRRAMSTSDG